MNLTVTEEAAKWYEDELDVTENTHLRFYVRYGGVGGLQPGFSLAIKFEEPQEPIAQSEVGKVTYFVEADDEWYFGDHSLKVALNEKWDEPDFQYES
ncbi:HesB/YadR/YfhF family protein [Halobacillus litoralis]|uniref:HesB/YadR/YfhF family protein n=1 Tax=Halobacillus litoralis TaxID=45668 RepID=UPI001CD1CF01|nr:HesB/YadR/YfhF family protein [Halobacillus litoralis]MCA0969023.1 HesB/YadR/YfhF family protein [Halobacillus litoralis]